MKPMIGDMLEQGDTVTMLSDLVVDGLWLRGGHNFTVAENQHGQEVWVNICPGVAIGVDHTQVKLYRPLNWTKRRTAWDKLRGK